MQAYITLLTYNDVANCIIKVYDSYLIYGILISGTFLSINNLILLI